MSLETIFTFGASTTNTYCETQVDSPISSKDLSRKRKQFEPDLNYSSTLKTPPRSATMPEYDNEEKQKRKLTQRQSRQTRSQTIAHRLEAERVQHELDAYLDHIKSLALTIEMQQMARESHALATRQLSPETEARPNSSRRRNRLQNWSISKRKDSEENDADTEWEPFEKRKVRVQPKTTEKMCDVPQAQGPSE